jgi:hypothetical protein
MPEDHSLPGEVKGMLSGEVAAQQRPRWTPEVLVDEICMERPKFLLPTMPAADQESAHDLC